MNVLVPTYHHCPRLEAMLQSVVEAAKPNCLEHIWVLENGSPGAARTICEKFEGKLPIQYRHIEQSGKTRALEEGMSEIRNGFVIFLDDDVRIAPKLLTAYAEAIREDDKNVVYGGPISIDYDREPPAWLTEHLPQSACGYEPPDPENVKGTGWFIGSNFAAFIGPVQKAGGFDPTIGPGAWSPGSEGSPLGDEMDLQRRMYRRGADAVYVPDARVWHHVPRDRCSVRWALNRHYRTAMTNALEENHEAPGATWFGMPRWLVKRMLLARGKAIAANFVPGAQKRFELKLDYMRWRGHYVGMRQQQQLGRQPVAPLMATD